MSLNLKLLVGAVVVAGTIAYVVYVGGSSSLQYYLLVDECVEQTDQLRGKFVRVSGQVAGDSLKIASDRRAASFLLEGNKFKLAVDCAGPLPDNLKEGIDVVVEGRIRANGEFQGEKVITRCASKYAEKQNKNAASTE